MALSQWGWVKRGSSTSRINNALYKCDTHCMFLLFFKCCHFNHRNNLKILLTLSKSFCIGLHACIGIFILTPEHNVHYFFKNVIYLFHVCFLTSVKLVFHFWCWRSFFPLKFTDFIPDSFQTICFALQIYVTYESWLWKLLFTAFNNVIIYKLHKQYILVITSYHLGYSEYKHEFRYVLYRMYIYKNLVKLQQTHAFFFLAILYKLSLGLHRHPAFFFS